MRDKKNRRLDVRTGDLLEESADVVVLEGQTSAEHHIQDDAAAPHIHLRPRVQRAPNHLRRGVVRAPAAGLHEVAVLDLVREAKVGDLDVEVVVEEDVLGLEVAVHDLEAVGVVDAGDHLLEEAAGLRLGHLALVDDVLEELPAGIFEHDDDVRWGRDHFIAAYAKVRYTS